MVRYRVTNGVSDRGIDAIPAQQAGLAGYSDEIVLEADTRLGRVVYTNDRDYLRIHSTGVPHAGIIFHREGKYSINQAIEDLEIACKVFEMDEMRNRVHWF